MMTYFIPHVAVRKHHQQQQQGEILIFLPALYWNQQSCFSVGNVLISNKRMLCEMRVFIVSAQAYAVRTGMHQVSGAYILHDRVFLKTSFG